MAKGKLILLGIMIFQMGCTSRLLVSTKGCKTKASWSAVEREFSTSLGDKFASRVDYQAKYFDKVIVERIWTPIGQFSREKLYLSDLLRLNGLNCTQISKIEVTYFNDYIDIISSAIPFLSSRSVMLKLRLKR